MAPRPPGDGVGVGVGVGLGVASVVRVRMRVRGSGLGVGAASRVHLGRRALQLREALLARVVRDGELLDVLATGVRVEGEEDLHALAGLEPAVAPG